MCEAQTAATPIDATKMATSADMREFFRVFREEINRAENKLETSVVTKVKELESKIEMLEKKVHKLSGKPARPEEEKR